MENIMKKITENMTTSGLPCDICGEEGWGVELMGKRGVLCNNPACREVALKRIEEKKDKERLESVKKTIEESGIPSKYKGTESDRDYKKFIPGKGVYLWGKAGAGKTVMACSILREYARRGEVIKYKSVPMLIMEIQDSYRNGEEGALSALKKVSNIPVLLIDDLGTEKNTEFVSQALYCIINEREQWERTTIITSNYSIKDFHTKDARLASRISGMCEIIHLTGEDRRFDTGKG